MQKKLTIILILFILIFICSVTTIKLLDKVPDNEEGTIGNTSGNLINEGLFCEDDGIIYFSNALDNGYLYSMNSDLSDVKLIFSAPVSYINSAGDFLYFYQSENKQNEVFGSFVRNNGIYRLKKNSNQDVKCLDRTPAKALSLVGSDLFYEHYNTKEGIRLYNVSIRGGDRHEVCENEINPACVYEANIFFPDVNNNFYLSCFRPATETANVVISDMKVFDLQYDNGFFYFMNVSDDYKLYRYHIGDDSVAKLTDCRVDAFNVHNDVIFYQKNGTSDAALIRISADGSNQTVIAEGNYKNISLTDNYCFFKAYDTDDIYYYCSLFGSPAISTFSR